VKERHTTVPSDAVHLPALMLFMQEFWAAEKLSLAQAMPFELALEEIFLNIVMHGAAAGAALHVGVSLALLDDAVTMTVTDDGPQFNPLSLPPPDLAATLADRPVGGQGVHLVRQMMDAVSYQRVGTHNHLCMSKRVGR
jgi:serine/threonine-protein kinase RsbW